MMKKYITIILTILFLSGCTVRGPSVTVDPGGVYIPGAKVQTGNPNPGKGCPPGLAKQGRCR